MSLLVMNLKRHCKSTVNILCMTVIFFLVQSSAYAGEKVDAVLATRESMQEHTSDEPRRVMHDVLLEEFAKSPVLHIVNPENSASPVKFRPSEFVVGANLIAFSIAPNTPMNISLSIQLARKSTARVILTSDRALYLDEKIVESGLKLKKPEFEQSAYGKAIITLSRMAAKAFDAKVQEWSGDPR